MLPLHAGRLALFLGHHFEANSSRKCVGLALVPGQGKSDFQFNPFIIIIVVIIIIDKCCFN